MKLQSPLRRWDVVAGICAAINARSLVEIGSKEGRFAKYILDNLPDIRVTTIDPWDDVAPNEAESYVEWNWDAIKEEYRHNTAEHGTRVSHLRMTSIQAVDLFGPRSVDVVFIDGAHDYENVLRDISAWWPVVSEHGFLSGHDYQHKFPGVHRAVAAHFDLMRVAVMADSVWAVAKNGGAKR